MKKTVSKAFALSICLVLLLVGTGVFYWINPAETEAAAGMFKTLTPKEAQSLLSARKDVVVLDVRGPEELREGWIAGSVLMPLPDILKGSKMPPKDKPLLLVCAVGGRSLGLGQLLVRYGWPEVYNLEGGISNWKKEGLPLKY